MNGKLNDSTRTHADGRMAASPGREASPGHAPAGGRPEKALAIVLARAGSKGVPGKNVAVVGGKPCVEWTILAARESRHVGELMISTDCPRVREVGERYGVPVLSRPPALAGDDAPVDAAAREALLQFERGGPGGAPCPRRPIVLLYANVPLRPAELIDECVRTLEATGAESVQSYSPVGKNHPWWTCVVEGDGRVRPFLGGPEDALFHGVYRRQDLPPAHMPDGGATVVTRRALMLELPGVAAGPHAFLGPPEGRRGVLTPEGSVVDIDSALDVAVADAALKGRTGLLRWTRRGSAALRRAG